MRGADARSAQIDRPCGVSRRFQVSEYSVEPSEAVFARNLLSKHDIRVALADEVVEVRPEVPLVSNPAAFACRGERLARATACPDPSVVGPACRSQGVAPDADSGEEVALSVAAQVVRADVFNGSFINISGRYNASRY